MCDWKSFTGGFAPAARKNAWAALNAGADAMQFGMGMCEDTVLSRVFLALRPIPATSAANERNWSDRGFHQNKYRSRLVLIHLKILLQTFSLATKTASMETYISYNLKHMQTIQGIFEVNFA